MPKARHGTLALHYDDLGARDGAPVLLLAGAGRPATDFDALFCAPLIAAGLRLIRVDSRDTGLSDGFPGQPASLRAVQAGGPPPYTVEDMARDVLAVMDHAAIARAHVVGRSLGAQVAQVLAIRAPERVRSLALIMASSRSVGAAIPDAVLDRLESEEIADEAHYIERQRRIVAANGLPQDQQPERILAEARAAWARGIVHGGTARHFAASLGLPDLRPALAALRLPVLIVHGRHDRVIPPALAQETAAAIPGAVLELRDDMGHDGPPRLRQLWAERLVDWITPLDSAPSHM